MLTTGAGGAIGINAQVSRVDLDLGLLVHLGQNRHGAGGGVNTALRLGLRHPLHAMRAGLELELGVDRLALNPGDDFLVAAVLAGVFRQHLNAPALTFGVTAVHAKQVAGEDSGFIATGAGADFQKHIAVVVRVLGQQQAVQLFFQLSQLRSIGLQVFLGHLPQVRIAILEQAARLLDIVLHTAPLLIAFNRAFQLGVLLGVTAKARLIADHLGVAEQRGQFFESLAKGVQPVQQGCFHESPCAELLRLPGAESPRAKSSCASASASTRPCAVICLS